GGRGIRRLRAALRGRGRPEHVGRDRVIVIVGGAGTQHLHATVRRREARLLSHAGDGDPGRRLFLGDGGDPPPDPRRGGDGGRVRRRQERAPDLRGRAHRRDRARRVGEDRVRPQEG